MDKLTQLYEWLHQEGVFLFDRGLPFSNKDTKSVSIKLKEDGTWGIFVDAGRLTSRAEEREVLFHEAGHFATGTTHEVCSPFDLIEKHEYKANKWAIKNLIPKDELEKAVREGCSEPWELAEYFDVPQAFMEKAMAFWKAQESA